MKANWFVFISVTVIAACSSQTSGTPPDGPEPKPPLQQVPSDPFPNGSAAQKADWANIVALEEQAKAIVRTDGCSAEGDCNTAPVGSRGCGGPRYYLVYCSRTTDVAALTRKLDEVAAAERAFNIKYQIGSTCEFRMPPAIGLVAGACSAK